MQRLEIIGPPLSPSGRATCRPRYPPFRISFGRDRQSSPLFAPCCLGIVRVITIIYIEIVTFVRSIEYPRSQNIGIKKKKRYRLICLFNAYNEYMNIREFSFHRFIRSINWWNDKDKPVFISISLHF